MLRGPRVNKDNNAFAKYFKILLAIIAVISTWTVAHYLKNFYLGENALYERHQVATVEVNFCLLIASIIFVKCYLKEFAFTLVELSIVLIIIGFIVAGISVGTQITENARLNSTIKEFNELEIAMMMFQERYRAIPGDMANATTYWGGATANGNGNNRYEAFWIGEAESLRAWQQLALAGFIKGSYTGTGTATRGVNVVPGSINQGSVYYVRYDHNGGVFAYHNDIALSSTTNWGIDYPIVTCRQAYSLDLKMDDGLPGSGKMIAHGGCANFPYGANTPVPANQAYLPSVDSRATPCYALFGYTFKGVN